MPGTGLARQHPAPARFLWNTALRAVALVAPGMSTTTRSGHAYAWILASPDLDGTTGRYLDYRRRDLPWTGSDRLDQQEELYSASLELCGLTQDPLAKLAA
jgi:hypothetical protein